MCVRDDSIVQIPFQGDQGWRGRVDFSGETLLDEEGDSAAVVDVGMGEEQRLQRAPNPPPFWSESLP